MRIMCPSQRDVFLIERQLKEGIKKMQSNFKRPFQRGVGLTEVSVKRELIIFIKMIMP